MTIIDEEFQAVREELGAYHEVGHTAAYSPIPDSEATTVNGYPIHPFVVAQAPDRANDPAGELPADLYECFAPEIFALVGIAGGVQREKIKRTKSDGTPVLDYTGPAPGDVVVAKFVHFWDYAKNIPSGRYLRYFAIDHPCSDLVARHARTVSRDDHWKNLSNIRRPVKGEPRCWVEEIVVTNQLAGNPSSREQQDMLARFDNAMAVEMESIGIAREMHHLRKAVHYDPLWICIRGISDVVYATSPSLPGGSDNAKQRDKWKLYASAIAASFARAVIERILEEARPGITGDAGVPPWGFPPK
ncbi:hypothetical protein [Streptomyces sp. NBC_01727]|uniref:hypothetical protein n=1 Tax=Streptomyces sp. NBC_01727 TaxID=2975924 RepID=UPI002E14F69B|nr:hypothetical protein OIE76_17790 [Streptomyces sp. NBC_01727]